MEPDRSYLGLEKSKKNALTYETHRKKEALKVVEQMVYRHRGGDCITERQIVNNYPPKGR